MTRLRLWATDGQEEEVYGILLVQFIYTTGDDRLRQRDSWGCLVSVRDGIGSLYPLDAHLFANTANTAFRNAAAKGEEFVRSLVPQFAVMAA